MKNDEKKDIPIEEAINIGSVTGSSLRSVGINTLQDLVRLGWESSFLKLIMKHPKHLNRNACVAIIGAIDGTSWLKVSRKKKDEAGNLIDELKRKRLA